MSPVELAPVDRRQEKEAARILAEALVDDPGWVAIGPGGRARRLRMLRGHQRGVLALARRAGGPVHGAFADSRLTGVAVLFGEGTWPPPFWSLAFEARGMVASGPGTVLRGLKAQAKLQEAHPREPHVYVWMLGVDPAAQRRGAGRSLLERTIADAEERELPVYLETSNPDNLPYYGAFGFERTGEAPLPRGATVWFLRRDSD